MIKAQASNSKLARNTDSEFEVMWTLKLLMSNTFLHEGFPQSAGESLFL